MRTMTAGVVGSRRTVRWLPRGSLGWSVLTLLVPVVLVTVCRALAIEVGPLAWVIAFTPYMIIPAAVSLVLSLMTRTALFALIAGVCVAIQLVWQAPLFGADSLASDGGRTLTVMTSNLRVGRGDATAVVELARAHAVDMLAIEELKPDARAALADAGLDRLLRHRWLDASNAGIGIWSRHSLASSPATDMLRWPTIGCVAAAPGLRLTFVAVHSAAPLTPDHTAWTADQPILRAALDSVEGPVVAAGDFNATLDHKIMRQLQDDGWVDAAAANGAGINATWPQGGSVPFPLVAIDHVMQRGAPLVPVRVQTAIVPNSDHRALIVTYRY